MKNIKKSIIVIFISMILTSTIFASSYKNQLNDLEEQKENAEDSIKSSQENIKQIDKNIDELVSRIVELDDQIEQFDDKINNLDNQVLQKEEEINIILKKLEEAKKQQKIYFEQTKKRIKVMYEHGDSAYLDVLLEAKDLSDLLNVVEYTKALVKYDTNMIDKLNEIKETIASNEVKLEKEKESLVQLKNEYELQKTALNEVHSAKEKEMSNLNKDKARAEAEVEAIKREREQIEKAIDKIKSKLTYGGGKMNWPFTNNRHITSPFKMRWHPVLKRYKFHSGIDIGSSIGTPVKAVHNGIVTFAGKGSAWGYYILIDHGSGYVTIYAHNSKLLVKKGDKVKIGQTIAKSGNTGWSTGPHLHFGVRKDGKWINPLDMLPKK
ncbi:MAG: peptidoglycan DD-metalloendopeptidase family protein [Vallitalea sp.]|nr:peptidoglycan DD-metalloendopeptidase family protein [Vallitalea sp.]